MFQNEEQTKRERVISTLVFFGAPLAGAGALASMPLEDALIKAVQVSQDDATVLRVLPVVVLLNRSEVDWQRTVDLAREEDVLDRWCMLVDLAGQMGEDSDLREKAARWGRDLSVGEAKYYMTRFDDLQWKLAERRTPSIVRRWGFRMNMTYESFRSMVAKFA